MPLGYWSTIYFRKVLTSLLWEIKQTVRILIAFFFLFFLNFLWKLSLTGLLTNILRTLVSMTHVICRDGNEVGWGRRIKDGVYVFALHGFVLSHPCSTPHDEKNFLTSSPSLGALRNPVSPCKTLLLVNFPYN